MGPILPYSNKVNVLIFPSLLPQVKGPVWKNGLPISTLKNTLHREKIGKYFHSMLHKEEGLMYEMELKISIENGYFEKMYKKWN